MNCHEYREQLIAYAEGLLDEAQARELKRHLEACPGCRAIHEENAKLHEGLLKSGRRLEEVRLENDVMDRIVRKQAHALRSRGRRIRRIAGSLAAAVVVLGMGLVGYHLLDQKTVVREERPAAFQIDQTDPGAKIDDWALGDSRKPTPPMSATSTPHTKAQINKPLFKDVVELGYGGSGTTPDQARLRYSRGSSNTLGDLNIKAGAGIELTELEQGRAVNDIVSGKPGDAYRNVVAAFGFSVGGAKDIANFRENIENGYLPLPTDVTPEGLFYDYYFDTSGGLSSDDLFYPGYGKAVTRDPFSKEVEYYLTVGLNSGMKSFERRPLNLVIVLDVSGSMKEDIDDYHYDGNEKVVRRDGESPRKPKIEVAKESLLALLDQLNAEDRFGMVVFSNQARLAKPLRPIGGTDMERVRGHIGDLFADGSTNLSAGMELGASLYTTLSAFENDGYENRIVVITDAQPNQGNLQTHDLLDRMKANADKRLFTTFVGIGVDFNSKLVEGITKTRGANYYSAHNSAEFKRRMVDEFEFMVTPLVFDLKLNLESGGFRIAKVIGCPMADAATGTLMKINTLFPSPSKEGRTKGGVVLLKLEKKDEPADDEIFLSVTYEDCDGKEHRSARSVRFVEDEAEHFDHTGVRKAVLLARYANLLKDWMIFARLMQDKAMAQAVSPASYLVNEDRGIIWVSDRDPALGPWERKSLPLEVSDTYRQVFDRFKEHLESEMEAIGDASLEGEAKVLERLARE